MESEKLIKYLKETNPYPIDIFPEPNDEDWKRIGNFLKNHGKNPDRIFAKFGRLVWQNCVNHVQNYIEENKS